MGRLLTTSKKNIAENEEQYAFYVYLCFVDAIGYGK